MLFWHCGAGARAAREEGRGRRGGRGREGGGRRRRRVSEVAHEYEREARAKEEGYEGA